jgi:hypothetical protein
MRRAASVALLLGALQDTAGHHELTYRYFGDKCRDVMLARAPHANNWRFGVMFGVRAALWRIRVWLVGSALVVAATITGVVEYLPPTVLP